MLRCVVALTFGLGLVGAVELQTGEYLGRPVTFEVQEGMAVYHGDILLGPAEELVAAAEASAGDAKGAKRAAAISVRLWPEGRVPYLIDATVSQTVRALIPQAVEHWNSRTLIQFVPRTTETNFVRFQGGTSTISCSSFVGMIGGGQSVRVPEGCSLGAVIHEMGHVVGLWHEQERFERNRSLTVLYENISKAYADQYDIGDYAQPKTGPYDFGSIMQYSAGGFSRDGVSPTMETVPAGIPLGQRVGLSAADVDYVQRFYGAPPRRTVISTVPAGLRVVVDGQLVDDGTAFEWAAGSTHTLEARAQGDNAVRHLFGSWSDGGAAAHTITATPDRTVYIANFIRQRRLTLSVTPAGSGTIDVFPASPDGFYTERSTIQFTARPAAGFSFVSWNLTPSRSANPKQHAITSTNSLVLATFSALPVTSFTSTPTGRLVIVDGQFYSTPVNFAFAPGSNHAVDIDTEQPDFVQYRFEGWEDGATQARSITAGATGQTYHARFTTRHALTVTNTSITSTPFAFDGFYDEGSRLTMTARARTGQFFQGWTGDLGGATTPTELLMDGEKLVGATYGTLPPTVAAVHAGTQQTGSIAPGEIVVIYGTNLGGVGLTTGVVSGGRLINALGGTQVFFGNVAAPLIYASATQVSAVVPYALANQTLTTMVVSFGGRTSAPLPLNVTSTAPGLFTANLSGRGPAAALNQNGSVNGAANPARRGEIVVLYATGEGATTPAGVDGQVATSVYPKPNAPVSVRIGGQPAVVHYAGAAPGFVAGAMQINVQVPEAIRTGNDVPVQLVIGDNASRSEVTLAIQ